MSMAAAAIRDALHDRAARLPESEVIYLHPAEEKLRLEGDEMVSQRLNQLLYGAQDYAIWARKA